MTRARKVDREAFLRLHEQGRSLTQLADQFQVSPRTAARLRHELGLSTPNAPGGAHRMTPEWFTRAEQLLNEGASIKDVADTLGCDEKTVARHFPGRGWTKTHASAHAANIRQLNATLRKRGIRP